MTKLFVVFCFLALSQIQATTTVAGKKHKLNDNVPSELMSKMRNWILTAKPGENIDFAGGKLYRIDEGARFVDNLGVMVIIPLERPDYNYIANKSPALARYWAEKYNFKPLPLDYEYDKSTVIDDKIMFFDSLNSSMIRIRLEEKQIRQKIAEHTAVKKDFSCVSFFAASAEETEVRTLCDQLIKLGTDHKALYEKMTKLKQELDAKGKNDLNIPDDAKKFEKDFSPFIFKIKI